ncbi:response regulator transcription factor [Glycomyces sambucus]|uniref:response regulator transcription factor n=1 Tax=Glycomyces sambucus TaxID=380244 RepID=UPI001C40A36B|nr:hypothetical protein [Glycomyces sambucus]
MVTPSTTAAAVSAVRPGRANGRPSPRLTERGSGVPLRRRWTRRPRPPRGAEPALTASAAESRWARSAGPSAVKTHVARIFAKLGLRDRAQAVVVAYETGLVTPGGGVGPED